VGFEACGGGVGFRTIVDGLPARAGPLGVPRLGHPIAVGLRRVRTRTTAAMLMRRPSEPRAPCPFGPDQSGAPCRHCAGCAVRTLHINRYIRPQSSPRATNDVVDSCCPSLQALARPPRRLHDDPAYRGPALPHILLQAAEEAMIAARRSGLHGQAQPMLWPQATKDTELAPRLRFSVARLSCRQRWPNCQCFGGAPRQPQCTSFPPPCSPWCRGLMAERRQQASLRLTRKCQRHAATTRARLHRLLHQWSRLH